MTDAPEALVKDGEGTYSVFSHEQAERARIPEELRTRLDARVGDVAGHIIDLDPFKTQSTSIVRPPIITGFIDPADFPVGSLGTKSF